MHLERSIVKNNCPGVCPLNNKFYKSPPMPGRGEVGLYIDRCITPLRSSLLILSIKTSSLCCKIIKGGGYNVSLNYRIIHCISKIKTLFFNMPFSCSSSTNFVCMLSIISSVSASLNLCPPKGHTISQFKKIKHLHAFTFCIALFYIPPIFRCQFK